MQRISKIVFTFIFFHHFCFPQNVDTLKFPKSKNQTFFFTSECFENIDSANFVINTLENLQNYSSHNCIGNSGMAISKIQYPFLSNEVGFFYNENYFINYFYNKEKLLFYDTKVPYSDLMYIIGSKQEQNFKLTFSYNVKQNWNVTANFYRIRSEGFYLRQSTNDNFLSISSIYKSKSNRYNLLVGGMYNYIQNAENGGISNDSIFETGVDLDKKLLDVNLVSAKRKDLNRSVFINQHFNFGKQKSDSVSNALVIPSSRISLSTSFDDNLLKYEDDNPLSGFYSNVYYDSLQTRDSVYNLKFENELAWKRIDNKLHRGFKDKLGLGMLLKDCFVRIKQKEMDTVYNNIILGSELFNTYSSNKFWFKLIGQYAIEGYNKNDYVLLGGIKKGLFDSLTFITLNASSKVQMPDFIFSRYSSNNFKWKNTFDKVLENSVELYFSMKKNKLLIGINYREVTNPVYFDNYAIARQYKGSIPILAAELKKNFSFNNWHLNNSIQYQYVPDSMVIRLPEYIFEHSLFYENDLFKNAMRLQIGVSVFLITNYFSNNYMPATGQFYLQNDKEYGNYPFFDFFIDARVKSVRVFFKIDHINSGWSGNKYQMTPHYPLNDRAFKLGISWRFYD